MKNRLQLIKWFLIAWAIIVVVSVIAGYINHLTLTRYNIQGLLPSSYTLPSEDSGVISKKYLDKIKAKEVYNCVGRNPVAHLIFDEKFKLAIYKIDIKPNFNFNDSFDVHAANLNRTLGVEYRITGDKLFYLLHEGGVNSSVSKIYLSLGGDSLVAIAKNDSIISYHLLCKNLAIRYSLKEPIDLFFEAKQSDESSDYYFVSLDILFLKRNNAIYLFLMSPIEGKNLIEPALLYQIVTGT